MSNSGHLLTYFEGYSPGLYDVWDWSSVSRNKVDCDFAYKKILTAIENKHNYNGMRHDGNIQGLRLFFISINH